MALDSNDVERVARLARLQVNAEEATELTGRLNRILGMVDELQQADVANTEPLAHPLEVDQPLRDDQVSETDIRDRVMPLAPAAEDGCYLVPRVIE